MVTRETGGAVAIIVTHYRNLDELLGCLASIVEFGGRRVVEVWIADSEAIAGVRSFVHETLPEAHYLPFRRNVGFAALVNMGVAASLTPYVMVLNADVRLTAGCMEALADGLDSIPSIGVLCPQLRYSDNSLQHSTFAFYRPSTVLYRRTALGRSKRGQRELERFLAAGYATDAPAPGQPVDVDWALGAAMMIRREVVDEVGPLDERYFLYFEDVDWCLRAWRAGWRCSYLPTAICTHAYARASARGGILGLITNRLTRRHVRSAIRFFWLYGRRITRPPLDGMRGHLTSTAETVPEPKPDPARNKDLVGGNGG